jgi:hypothetical protein
MVQVVMTKLGQMTFTKGTSETKPLTIKTQSKNANICFY